ncbi:acyl-CoA dehydrogenase [Rhodococcoides trifolii]|uniref:Acyl-CoA dehydrogenase n=1 Tax=Rhodococcoides trifolii TaxID=908250 RepID=A0A917G2P8_9NOCA|nr:acyl-CoA dehydrogenase family protein [Rhodococcus trifolii]GGG20192.1 acyl-CoA dehydrogenase [Rhodococcus trifolii]
MTVAAVSGLLDLPLPGGGRTRERWTALQRLARENVVLGRMAEAHADAVAILAELGGPSVGPSDSWGVWAAEPPEPILVATRRGSTWSLSGRKPWCSGASSCTHALVTARVDGTPALFAVDLRVDGVEPVPDTWHAVGMAGSDSGAVDFDDVAAQPVGATGDYLSRPGFWHGAIGVAACWFGGALAVADVLYDKCERGTASPHALAHLGGVDASLAAASYALDCAATEIDKDPSDRFGEGRMRALRVRRIVEQSVTDTLDRVGRALGAGPLCMNADHAQRVADLGTYIRQSHAEQDLEALGQTIVEKEPTWRTR